MLRAWDAWQDLQRQRAHLAEIPVAQLTAMMRNIHADGPPVPPREFLVFADPGAERREFAPEVAATLLELEHQNRSHPLLRACWAQVKDAATSAARVPDVRAWASDCGEVWIVCPVIERGGVRGGLVAVGGQHVGTMEVADIDRPLLRYRVSLPDKRCGGWLQAGFLLAMVAT